LRRKGEGRTRNGHSSNSLNEMAKNVREGGKGGAAASNKKFVNFPNALCIKS
jgi:hypothetical protein